MANRDIASLELFGQRLRGLICGAIAKQPDIDPVTLAPKGESFAFGTTRGKVRNRNEDRVAVLKSADNVSRRPRILFALCDGIGGMVEGARAADLTLSSFLAAALSYRTDDLVQALIYASEAANAAVYREFGGRGGATLSAFCWDSSGIVTVNVGDSRIWALDVNDKLQQLTQDDSIAGQLEARGIAESADARRDLLQFIGIGKELQPHVKRRVVDKARLILATSDGAHELPPQMMAQIVKCAANPREAVSRLLDLSRWCGGRDNASVVCFEPNRESAEELDAYDLWAPAGHSRIAILESPTVQERRPISPSHGAAQTTPPVSTGPRETDQTARSKSGSRRRKRDKRHKDSSKSLFTEPRSRDSGSFKSSRSTDSGHIQIDIGQADGPRPLQPPESGSPSGGTA